MRIFKNKIFNKWASEEKLDDDVLKAAVAEIEQGLVDAYLGGGVIKKRVAMDNRGKSGGVRTLLAYKMGDKAFFVYGFAKKNRANISTNELKALKRLAKELFSYDDMDLAQAIEHGKLIEVDVNG